jgi:hypothetical protein
MPIFNLCHKRSTVCQKLLQQVAEPMIGQKQLCFTKIHEQQQMTKLFGVKS